MNQEISIFRQRFQLIPMIFVIIGIVILILLGNWQLKRLNEKTNFIQSIEYNIANHPKSIEELNLNLPIYSKIAISGTFLAGKNIFLYGKRSASPEKDGYYLLSAFEATNGKIYLVSRGWIPQSVKNNLGEFASKQIFDKFEAIILPSETRQFMMPENDKNNKIWFTIDLDMAHEMLGVTENKYYLMQIQSATLPEGGKPLSTEHLNKVRNDHFEYAITWYSLAACLLIMFFIYRKKLL
jgi:surfeit locus 1 family protein